MALPKYLDFDLLIERAGDRFRARVLDSPGGQGVWNFDLPFDDRDLQIFSLQILGMGARVRRIDDPGIKEVRDLGAKLFEAVFVEDVLTCLDKSLYEAERQQIGLRLRLQIEDEPTPEGVSLSGIPWEFLFDRRSGGLFLTLSDKSSVVRSPSVPRSVEPLLISPPLRLLAMISSPRGFVQLDVDAEWRNLNEALEGLKGQGKIVLDRLEPPTLEALQGQLRRGGPYHVFHFIGHGTFDEHRDEGLLLLETSEGKPAPASGEELRFLLEREPSLRLAILNACDGARTSKAEPSAGIAQSLLQGGVPAVIAMQMPVTDKAAIAFSREFYGALADGYPVDAAVAEARAAIYRVSLVEWGVPVLYMRARDGLLFAVEPQTTDVGNEFPELPMQAPHDQGEVARDDTKMDRLAKARAERKAKAEADRKAKAADRKAKAEAEGEALEEASRQERERHASRAAPAHYRRKQPKGTSVRRRKNWIRAAALIAVVGISVAVALASRNSATPTVNLPARNLIYNRAVDKAVERLTDAGLSVREANIGCSDSTKPNFVRQVTLGRSENVQILYGKSGDDIDKDAAANLRVGDEVTVWYPSLKPCP